MPCSRQTRSKICGPRKRRVGPSRFFGRSAKAMPLSVRTVCILRKGCDDIPEEGGAFHFPGMLVELDIGELRDPVDGEEHDEFAVGVGEFGAVDVDIANVVGFEPLALFCGLARWEARYAMALKTTVQGTSAEIWNGVLQTAEDIIQWQ